jgi:hypothetical protein
MTMQTAVEIRVFTAPQVTTRPPAPQARTATTPCRRTRAIDFGGGGFYI